MPARKYSWQCILICVAVLFPCGFFQSKLLGQHFNSSDSLNFNLPAQNTGVSILAVGDVMLGSWIIPILNEKGSSYPFAHTSPYLQSADIAFANLEAPFTQDGEAFEKKYNFKVPPEYAQGIRTAGMDVVSLANNHIMDYGQTGLVSTIKILDEIGMQHCGAGLNLNQAHQPAVLKVNDKTIAFFAYSMTFPVEFYAKSDSSGTAYPEPELMQCALLTWEELVDFTVVSFHWSAEKLEIPKDYQIYFAHLAIDSGADLVLGHHPHVLQGLEIYKNRLIAYSLGNFVFGSYSRHAVDSIILKAYLNEEGLFYAQCIPIIVDNRDVEFQPEIANGQRKLDILSKLQQLSLSLNQDQNIMSDTGIILGEWRAFYDDWLLDTVISTYWNIEPEKDFITGHHIKIAKQVPESQLNPSN